MDYLKQIEKATFKGFQSFFDEASSLPVDIVSISDGTPKQIPEEINYSKTSPTNIGLGFLYQVLARDRGYKTEEESYRDALAMMKTLIKLETKEGFLYNWYYLTGKKEEIPQVVNGRFISSIDNGNLDVCLMVTSEAFLDTELSQLIEDFLEKRDYHFFYNKSTHTTKKPKNSINNGFDDEIGVYSPSDYKIFNTEARMVTLMSIVKNNLPKECWTQQSRLIKHYTTLDKKIITVVAPWSGNLFEALFADEILGGAEIAPNAFEINAKRLIQIHQDRGKRLSESGIWGFSNGEVPAEDRYEMAGIPEIAYNQFPGIFVTPYSTFLSLRYAAEDCISNFQAMEKLNPKAFNPNYGFTDSIHPQTGVVNNNLLALDKGMEVLSISNFMNAQEGKKQIPDYFWSYLKRKDWDKKAKELFHFDQHESAYQLLNKDRTKIKTNNKNPVSLHTLFQEMGIFFEPNRAKASHEVIEVNPSTPQINVSYDVSQRYSYCGLYFIFNEFDLTKYQSINLTIKGDEHHPETIKLEVKHEGDYVLFEHIPVTKNWQQIDISLENAGDLKIDELSFVIENSASGKYKKGNICFQSIQFS